MAKAGDKSTFQTLADRARSEQQTYRITVPLTELEREQLRASAAKGEAILPFFHLGRLQPMSDETDERPVFVGDQEERELLASLERKSTPPPVLYKHGKDPVRGAKAAGKVHGLTRIDPGDGAQRLAARCKLTAQAAKEVGDGEWYGVSAGVLGFEEKGQIHPFDLVEVSLVNTPAVDGLGEIMLFDRGAGDWQPWAPAVAAEPQAAPQEAPMMVMPSHDCDESPLCCIRAMLNLPVAATPDEMAEQIRRLAAQETTMEAQGDTTDLSTLAGLRPPTVGADGKMMNPKHPKNGKFISPTDARARKNQPPTKEAPMKLNAEQLQKLGLKEDAPEEAQMAALAVYLDRQEAPAPAPAPTTPPDAEAVANIVLQKFASQVEATANATFEKKKKADRVEAILSRLVDGGKLFAKERDEWRATVERDPDSFEKHVEPNLRVKAPVRGAQFYRAETGAVAPRPSAEGYVAEDGRPVDPRVAPVVVEGAALATRIHQLSRREGISYKAAEARVKLEREGIGNAA